MNWIESYQVGITACDSRPQPIHFDEFILLSLRLWLVTIAPETRDERPEKDPLYVFCRFAVIIRLNLICFIFVVVAVFQTEWIEWNEIKDFSFKLLFCIAS